MLKTMDDCNCASEIKKKYLAGCSRLLVFWNKEDTLAKVDSCKCQYQKIYSIVETMDGCKSSIEIIIIL